MAPSRPLPNGKASVHFCAGLVYHSFKWLGFSFAETKIELAKNASRKIRLNFDSMRFWFGFQGSKIVIFTEMCPVLCCNTNKCLNYQHLKWSF